MYEQTLEYLQELKQDIAYQDDLVVEVDSKNIDNYLIVKQCVLRKAYDMEQIIKYFPQEYDYPESTIFSSIMNDYKRKSVSDYTQNMIYKVFSLPEYDHYKTHVYNTAKRRQAGIKILDESAIGEKAAIDAQMHANIYFMKSNIDHPAIQNFLHAYSKDIQKQESKLRREKEDEEKITIPRPAWLPPGVDGQDSLLRQECLKMVDIWNDIAVRVWQYPPEKPEDDEYYAQGVKTMGSLLMPGTDLKYTRDTLSYLDITYEMMTQSIHSAKSKSKIVTLPSLQLRGMTREQVADLAPHMLLLSINVLEYLPGFIKLCMYWAREQKPYNAQFHINRHDKLSESSFGKSSFMD